MIVDRMRDKEIVSYSDLASGEPKLLVRFYHVAKGASGIAKYVSVSAQVNFLSSLEEEELEELLLLDAPPGYVAPSRTEAVASSMLKSMSDSTRRTIEYASATDRQVIREVANRSGAADGVDEAQASAHVAASGFNTSELPDGELLDTLPPMERVLAFGSEAARELKGRELVYKFPKQGWYRGRVLKAATDGTVKTNKRICNFRVFFEADDEFVNQPLYSQNYTTNAEGADHSWALVSLKVRAGSGAPLLELDAGPAPLLALM